MKKKLKLLLTLCAAAALSLGAIAFSACGDEEPSEHDHVWSNPETQTAATCTEPGVRTSYCLVEGCTEKQETPIPARGHSWGELKNTATCTEPGVMRQLCTREGCTEYKDDETQPTPPLGHDFTLTKTITEATCKVEGQGEYSCSRCTVKETRTLDKLPHSFGSDAETEPATCEEDGVIHGKCSTCDEVVDEVIPALGHNWTFSRHTKLPTCEEEGEDYYFCLRDGCSTSEYRVVPALGHTYDDSEIIYPTFDADGEETGHCVVCDQIVTTILPKLEDGQEIEFVFRISRNNGDLIGSEYMNIVVKDKNNTEVASGNGTNIGGVQYYGIIFATLPVHRGEEFTMTVPTLYAGYTANQESVKVTPEYPVGNYYVTAHIIESTERSPSSYRSGSIMQDFTVQDTKGNTINLKDTLKNNKMVMINFFGLQCFWCTVEFPGFIKAYNNYKDKGIEVICMAPEGQYANDLAGVTEAAEDYPFSVVYLPLGHPLYSLYSKFGLSGFPSSVFIDHEGVVQIVHEGMLTTEYNDTAGIGVQPAFEMMFETCVNWDWSIKTASAAAASVNEGLELAMIRGDYLPCDEQ